MLYLNVAFMIWEHTECICMHWESLWRSKFLSRGQNFINWGVHLGQNWSWIRLSFLPVSVEAWGKRPFHAHRGRGEGNGAPRVHSWSCSGVPPLLPQGLPHSRGLSHPGLSRPKSCDYVQLCECGFPCELWERSCISVLMQYWCFFPCIPFSVTALWF